MRGQHAPLVTDIYYRHSGRFSAGGLATALVAGAGLALVLGFVYAYSTLYIPFVQVSALLTVGYGAALGIATATILKRFNTRNTPLALLATFAVVCLGLWTAWSVWLYALLARSGISGGPSLPGIFLNPFLVVELIRQVNAVGAWSISRSAGAVTGLPLTAVWLAEAGLLFGTALYLASDAMQVEPFCEACGKWCGSPVKNGMFGWADAGVVRSRMEMRDVRVLGEAPFGPDDTRWISAEVCVCVSCGMTNTLTLTSVVNTMSRGKVKTKEKVIVRKLLVGQTELTALRDIAEIAASRLAQPASAAQG